MSVAESLEQQIDLDAELGRWCVVIYNNDHTPIDAVVMILIQATGCDQEEAEIETWEAHHFGRARVHFADQQECEQAAKVISGIGVRAEVCREWSEVPA